MRDWSVNRVCALVLGVIFLILGLVGFVTPPENSTGVQAIFGIFDSDTIHNIFYVLVGLLGIISAFTGYFRTFNKVFGVLFILLGLLGLIPALYFPAGSYGHDQGLFLGLTHLNAGDHILHLIAGVIAAVVGFLLVGPVTRPEAKATAHVRN
jgi:uncharacterized membrane protein YuzA (DUF378 family)